MGLGIVQFEGRKFEYKYEEPSEQAVTARANSLISENPLLTISEAKNAAAAEIRNRTIAKTEAKVSELLKKAWDLLLASKAEVGISQRLNTEVDLKAISGGLITREVRSDVMDRTVRIIPDSEAQKYPTTLAAILNNQLYEKKKRREQGDAKKGIAPDSQTIDLKVPSPYSELTYQEQMHEMAIYLSGAGDAGSQIAQDMTRLNRFGKAYNPGPRELTGFTFITRPHCNLSQANIANVRSFAPLLFCDDQSMQFAIRMLLDTSLQAGPLGTHKCELIDMNNPFLVPVCNGLKSINGFQDPSLGIETTEGGFFSESQTSVVGTDRLAHGYDLQLQFKDYPGGPILALHDYWCQYMGALGDGSMSQYLSDIEHNIMGYTVSIYRFVTDHTGRQITRWAKATGCFPKVPPTGSPFNMNEGEMVVQAVKDFSIPYQAHHFGYNDPIILREFNMLVRRYNDWISDNGKGGVDNQLIAPNIINNRAGIPYVIQSHGFNELVWLYNPNHAEREPLLSKVSEPPLTAAQRRGQDRIDQNTASVFGG